MTAEPLFWSFPCTRLASSGIIALLHSPVIQLMENRTQDCFKCCVQRLVLYRWRVNLRERKHMKAHEPHHTSYVLMMYLCTVFMLTLVNTFIVWMRKLASTSFGIGKR